MDMVGLTEAKPKQEMPKILIAGVGGGGGNTVNYMVKNCIEGVEYLSINTDYQALNENLAQQKLRIGVDGFGAGADPEQGKHSALENADDIHEQLKGHQMVFVTAGMGGGTGTGAAPVVAKIAKDHGSLVVGVVSMPFAWEQRTEEAEKGVTELVDVVDSYICIPNDRLVQVVDDDMEVDEAFDQVNEILYNAVQGITEIITVPGFINVDFRDLCTVMSYRGAAMMGVGSAHGEGRDMDALEQAINNPLIAGVDLKQAQGILVNVAAGRTSISEFNRIGKRIHQITGSGVKVIMGMMKKAELENDMRITLVATGLPQSAYQMESGDQTQTQTVTQASAQMPVETPVAALSMPSMVKEETALVNQSINPALNRLMTVNQANTHDPYQPHAPYPPIQSNSEPIKVEPKIKVVNESPSSNQDDTNKRYELMDMPAFMRRQAD